MSTLLACVIGAYPSVRGSKPLEDRLNKGGEMEDRDYQAMRDAIGARLATATLRFLLLTRSRATEPGSADVERLRWLRSVLMQSLGGARQVALHPEALAPSLEYTPGALDEEVASFAALGRFSKAENPEQHAEWVARGVAALENLSQGGWTALDQQAEVPLVEDSILPLLRWMSGANDRGSRDSSRGPLVGA